MSNKLKSGGFIVVLFMGVGAFQAITGVLDPGPSTQTASASTPAAPVKPGVVPEQYQDMVNNWGQICPELSPAILAAQLSQESGWNPRAQSGVGARGIAQFMPGTWANSGIDANKDGVKNVWDPEDAIPSAAVYNCAVAEDVRHLPGDDTTLMLAAYNAGPGAVLKYGGVPPYSETQNYVRVITSAAKRYQ